MSLFPPPISVCAYGWNPDLQQDVLLDGIWVQVWRGPSATRKLCSSPQELWDFIQAQAPAPPPARSFSINLEDLEIKI